MADFSHREVVTRRVEYFIPRPCNHAEFMKAYAAACDAYRAQVGSSPNEADDTLWVDAVDEEITISFVLPEKVAR